MHLNAQGSYKRFEQLSYFISKYQVGWVFPDVVQYNLLRELVYIFT